MRNTHFHKLQTLVFLFMLAVFGTNSLQVNAQNASADFDAIFLPGSIPVTWTNDATHPWSMVNGKLCFQDDGSDCDVTTVSFSYTSENHVDFAYKVGTNYILPNEVSTLGMGPDCVITIKVDGVEKERCGVYTQEDSISIPKGTHRVEFSYRPYSTRDYIGFISYLKLVERKGTTSQEINSAILTKGSLSPEWIQDENYPWFIMNGKLRNGNWGFPNTTSSTSFKFNSLSPVVISLNDQYDRNSYPNIFDLLVDGNVIEGKHDSQSARDLYYVPAGPHIVTLRDSVAENKNWRSINIASLGIVPYPYATSQLLNDSLVVRTAVPLTWENDTIFPMSFKDGCMQNSNVFFPQSNSWITCNFTIDKPTRVSFRYNINSDYPENKMVLEIDRGVVLRSQPGTQWQTYSKYFQPGTYSMQWICYSGSRNDEKPILIDDLELYNDWINIKVTPGSLGREILNKVNVLQDVKMLQIAGTLNESDWQTISQLDSLEALDLSQAVIKEVPDGIFESHRVFRYLTLPEGVRRIGENAFAYSGIEKITIPASVVEICTSAFQSSNLGSIDFAPNSNLQTFGDGVFEDCTNLTYSCRMPETVKEIGKRLFCGCEKLWGIYFSDKIEKIGDEVCYGTSSMSYVELPSNLKELGNYAFQYSGLKSVVFKHELNAIGSGIFNYCYNLESVELPIYVPALFDQFSSCPALKRIVCSSAIPPEVLGDPFNGSTKNQIALEVPSYALQSYKLDPYWYQFSKITAMATIPEKVILDGNVSVNIDKALPVKPIVELRTRYPEISDAGSITLNSNQQLSMSDFGMEWVLSDINQNMDEYKNSAALVNRANLRSDNVWLNMIFYDNKWSFISVPFNVKVSEVVAQLSGVNNWVVRKYDGQKRAWGMMDSTWVKMNPEDILKAGEGYIVQTRRNTPIYYERFRDYSMYKMCAVDDECKNNIFVSGDVDVQLKAYPSEFDFNRGWNLIGNPYPCYYDTRMMEFDAPITVWNMANSTYDAYSPLDDAFVLYPGQAFFVQCPMNATSIHFRAEGRQVDREVATVDSVSVMASRALLNNGNRVVANLSLSNGKLEDKTRVVFNEDATFNYEMDKDATKFMSMESAVSQLYSTQNGVNYAINERPFGNGVVELISTIKADGIYTISLHNTVADYRVVLVDKLLGKRVDLSEMHEYTFSASTKDADERFLLMFVNESTSIEDIDVDALSEDATIYTLQGIKVEHPVQSGVYIKNGKKFIVK